MASGEPCRAVSSPLVWAFLPFRVFSPPPWVALGSKREVQPLYRFYFVISQSRTFRVKIMNHAGFDDVKKNILDNFVIIKKGENVNNASFDDTEKNSLDNDCHHQKGGECEYMNTGF